jgi:drug/metabolite transporter (DMT)-like permease
MVEPQSSKLATRDRYPSPARRNDVIGIALAATATVIVGTAVAVSGELTTYPVLGAQAVRYGLGAALLVGWAALRRIHIFRPAPHEMVRLALLAATGLAGFNVCIVLALREAEPAAVGVVVGAVPLVLALAGPIAARERPAMPVLTGAILVVAGGALVQGFGRTTLVAFLLSLGALVGEAAFTLVAVPLLPRLGAVAVSLWSCALAAVMLAVVGIAADGDGFLAAPTAAEAGALLWLTIVVTAIAFVCWYAGVERLGPERAGLLAGLIPVAALVTGAALGIAGIGLYAALGTVLVAVGLTIGLRPPGRMGPRTRRRRSRE